MRIIFKKRVNKVEELHNDLVDATKSIEIPHNREMEEPNKDIITKEEEKMVDNVYEEELPKQNIPIRKQRQFRQMEEDDETLFNLNGDNANKIRKSFVSTFESELHQLKKQRDKRQTSLETDYQGICEIIDTIEKFINELKPIYIKAKKEKEILNQLINLRDGE